MERKHLIRPVTIVKVKAFLLEVSNMINEKKEFSPDALARRHHLSGSMGTALIRMEFIKPSNDIKGFYEFFEDPFVADEQNAVLLLEHIRLRNIDITKKRFKVEGPLIPNVNGLPVPGSNKNHKAGDDIKIESKSFKQAEISQVLEKIFSKLNEGKQSDLFDGINNIHNERIHVASAISSGVWASLGLGQDFPRLSEEYIREINKKIAFTTDDLMDQILNFKKSNK